MDVTKRIALICEYFYSTSRNPLPLLRRILKTEIHFRYYNSSDFYNVQLYAQETNTTWVLLESKNSFEEESIINYKKVYVCQPNGWNCSEGVYLKY